MTHIAIGIIVGTIATFLLISGMIVLGVKLLIVTLTVTKFICTQLCRFKVWISTPFTS